MISEVSISGVQSFAPKGGSGSARLDAISRLPPEVCKSWQAAYSQCVQEDSEVIIRKERRAPLRGRGEVLPLEARCYTLV